MDLKNLRKILEALIDERILTSELINVVSSVYEEDDVVKRNVYIRYDLSNKKYKRDKKQIRKIIDYLLKAYEEELKYSQMIVVFDQVEEEGGLIKRYVGLDYPISVVKSLKDKVDLMYI